MPSLWKAYKNQYRVVPLQQMTVFQPESDGQGKYRVMESCLNYSCLERQSLSLSIFCSFLFIELGEACPVAELPDITYTSRLRYFTPDPSQVSAFPLLRLSVFFTYANMSMSFFVGRRESNPCSLRRTDTQHIGSFIRLLYR